jgi:hypothetical protein
VLHPVSHGGSATPSSLRLILILKPVGSDFQRIPAGAVQLRKWHVLPFVRRNEKTCCDSSQSLPGISANLPYFCLPFEAIR